MKKFNFELQSLYDIKKREQDLQKKHMRKIDERINEISVQIEVLNSELKNTKEEMSREIGSSINAHKLNHYNHYITKILAHAAHQRRRIIKENERKESCVNQLIDIQKELKSLEKLKQKKYEGHLKELRKEEEKAIEDIISFKVAAS